jgi:exonuclease VII small subunit
MGSSANKRQKTGNNGRSVKQSKVNNRTDEVENIVNKCRAQEVFKNLEDSNNNYENAVGKDKRCSKTPNRVADEASNMITPHNDENKGEEENSHITDEFGEEDDDDDDATHVEVTTKEATTATKTNTEKLINEKAKYVDQMTDHGYFQGELSQRLGLKNHINKKMFTLVKFVTHEHQMNYDNAIATRIMDDLFVPEERRFQYWVTHQSFVTKTLRTKRNNICMTLKEAYKST